MTDKSGANLAGLDNMNVMLILAGWYWLIEGLQVKHLNNIIEQPSRGLQANPCRVADHRFIKKITRPMLGFKSFVAAQATLAGIETAHMIRKGQLSASGRSAFQQLAALAEYVFLDKDLHETPRENCDRTRLDAHERGDWRG